MDNYRIDYFAKLIFENSVKNKYFFIAHDLSKNQKKPY